MVKKAKPIILYDTNVFLDFYHDVEIMQKELNEIGFDRLCISTVTVGEVRRYMAKKEISKTQEKLNQFSRIYLSKPISLVFEQLMSEYRDHHPSVADCLIAATAISLNAQLFTFNRKHFTYYQNLTLYSPAYAH